MYANFADEDTEKLEMIGWFPSEQDPEWWPNVIPIEANDPRYLAYFHALPPHMSSGLPSPELSIDDPIYVAYLESLPDLARARFSDTTDPWYHTYYASLSPEAQSGLRAPT